MLVLSRRLQYKGERIPTQDAVFANANANRAAILSNKLKLGFCGAGFGERTGHQNHKKRKAPLLWCFLVVLVTRTGIEPMLQP